MVAALKRQRDQVAFCSQRTYFQPADYHTGYERKDKYSEQKIHVIFCGTASTSAFTHLVNFKGKLAVGSRTSVGVIMDNACWTPDAANLNCDAVFS